MMTSCYWLHLAGLAGPSFVSPRAGDLLEVWAHRNALSGFFRYVGNNGLISRDQVRWSLEALNSLVKGELLQAQGEV